MISGLWASSSGIWHGKGWECAWALRYWGRCCILYKVFSTAPRMSGAPAASCVDFVSSTLTVAASVLFCSFSPGTQSPALEGDLVSLGRWIWLSLRPSFLSLLSGWSSLIQESLQRPPPPALENVPPAGRGPLYASTPGKPPSSSPASPFSQSVVSAARAFLPLLRNLLRPLVTIRSGWASLRSLGARSLNSASPTVGFSRSSVPCVSMFIGLSAILSAAFGISHVPAFPHVVMICEDRVGNWTPMMDAVGGQGPSPHFRTPCGPVGGGRSVAAGVCQTKREQQFGIKDLGSLSPPTGPH